MDWRPGGYKLTTAHLVRGIFDANSDEAVLINNAAHGRIELFATRGIERITSDSLARLITCPF